MALCGPESNLGPRKLINRSEYIRLIEQALFKLGFAHVAKQLETDSGIEMQPAAATKLQEHLLAGNWEGALEILPSLLQGEMSSDEQLRDARFLIRQQQYLEALETGDTQQALDVLRNQLAALAGAQYTHRLHHLAGLLLYPVPADVGSNPEAARQWSTWLEGGVAHRSALVAQMQFALPPWLMMPDSRLEVLLEQALDAQIARCLFHNLGPLGSVNTLPTAGVELSTLPAGRLPHLSLLSDYQAGVESLPTQCIQVLDAHTDEVWHLSFSHSGTLLATGSKDKTAIVWAVQTPPPAYSMPPSLIAGSPAGASGSSSQAPKLPQLVSPLCTLQGHEAPVLFLSWSPDDSHLLSVSDVTLRLWDPRTGALRRTYTHHKEQVTCCAWMPDSTRFVSGSVDRTVAVLDIHGVEVQRWKRAYRVQDLAVSADGSAIIIAASDKHIHILRLSDQKEVVLAEVSAITSIDLSADGRFLLANLQSQAVHLWQLGHLQSAAARSALDSTQPVEPDPMDKLPASHSQEYRQPGSSGDQLGRYVVRSSFGGAAGSFVVHGSESGSVFIFHRDSGGLLQQLEGHTATVNACAWPPAAPQLLASASDDRTVRIWLSEASLRNAARGLAAGSAPQGAAV